MTDSKITLPARQRADVLLVARGLFDSRARAQAAIAAGLVRAGGRLVIKPSENLATEVAIEAQAPFPWVSRAGVKLAAALDAAGLDVSGAVALDVGASTGGFTEVLLARGARRVYAVDVGRDQLHPRLRGRPEVVSLEGTDIRALSPSAMDRPADVVTIDVSFIGLGHVLAPALALAGPQARLVALVKPQFEVGRAHLSRGGIVRDAAVRAAAVDAVAAELARLDWVVRHRVPSPIAGGDGNEETLLVAERHGS